MPAYSEKWDAFDYLTVAGVALFLGGLGSSQPPLCPRSKQSPFSVCPWLGAGGQRQARFGDAEPPGGTHRLTCQ
jgi:hypothetical protein